MWEWYSTWTFGKVWPLVQNEVEGRHIMAGMCGIIHNLSDKENYSDSEDEMGTLH